MLYADVKVMLLQFKDNECANIHKPIKQSYASKHYLEREKEAVLLLIPDDISIEEELYKMYVILNFDDDKKIGKEYEILDEDEDYVAINMNVNKEIEEQLNSSDFTISGNHAMLNKIKNYYKLKNLLNAKKLLSNEEYDCFMNNCKYHYIAVTKPYAFNWQNFYQSK